MAIYADSSLGVGSNLINFNDYTQTPIYRLISRTPQRRAVRELDIPIPFENGISDFETLLGQYVYVLEGRMYPGGESEYDNGLRALRKLASLEISQEDALSDEGYVPYTYDEFSQQKIVYLKVLYVQITEDTRKGLVQPFRFICKIKDPTIHGATLKTASTEQASPSTVTGTAVYAFSYPIIFGASTYSVTSNANNEGDLPAYPVSITVNGPISTPRITNTTTGEFIEVTTNLSTASNFLRITYDKDSLRVETDGVSVLDSVTAASTFFKLEPGGNEITLTGASISDGAKCDVIFRDAYPLS